MHASSSSSPHSHQPHDIDSNDDEDSSVSSTPLTILGKRILDFESISYLIGVAYFSILFISVLTGNAVLEILARFQNFVISMCTISSIYTIYFLIHWIRDIRQHVTSKQKKKDFQGTLTFAWRSIFWLAFILWYTSSPFSSTWVEVLSTPGAIMCLYGLALAASSALMTGHWSFLAERPHMPRVLITYGPYALLRHPQSLGNMLFLIGFSLAGGAYLSSIAFLVSFFLYTITVIPREERMMEDVFGVKYKHYKQNVPAFSWGLLLLLIAEAFLLWRYGKYAVPIAT